VSSVELRDVVASLLEAEEAGDLDAQDALRHPDFAEEYPQSGERIVGRDRVREMITRQPSLPSGMRWRLTTLDDRLVLAEIAASYGDEPWWIAGFFEGEDGVLTREIAYFGPAYPAPDWRAPWVEPITTEDWLADAGGHGAVTRDTAERFAVLMQAGEIDAFASLRHADWYGDIPQTGERFRGHANYAAAHHAYPGGMPAGEGAVRGASDQWVVGPAFAPTRVAGRGAHWALEGWLTYATGERFATVAVVEFRDGLAVTERYYYCPPFEPPAWRRELAAGT
jgi:hypothetical protein